MAQGSTKGIPIDTDVTLAANSNELVSSQRAVKVYVDTEVAAVAATIPTNTITINKSMAYIAAS